jgi:hypothetical protein
VIPLRIYHSKLITHRLGLTSLQLGYRVCVENDWNEDFLVSLTDTRYDNYRTIVFSVHHRRPDA